MKFKYIIPLILIFCIIFSSVVSAEEGSEKKYCIGELIPGDEYYIMVGVDFKVGDIIVHRTIDYSGTVTSSNAMMCLFLSEMSTSPTGFTINEHLVPQVNTYREYSDCGTYNTTRENTSFDCKPCEYDDPYYTSYSGETKYFITNIPIFQSYDEALSYSSGELGVEDALNYKKVFENGSYVSPFEDIEINDMDILVPTLSNVSHSGFSCTNNNDERYMVEVYVSSGIQNVGNYLDGNSSISDPFVENSFGLVSNNSEAQYNGSSISLFDCYGVDNVSALYNNLIYLYTTYPTVSSYQKANDYKYNRDDFTVTSPCFFDIWGRPFGKTYMFWRTNHEVNTADIDAGTVDQIPLCYTHYRVRYFYYDDDSGFHYGPWANVIYFSNGKIVSNAIFQDDNGNVIETTINNGIQDESGNVSYDNSNFIDLNDTNSLFGNLRSIFNNMTATNNTFSQLFGSVFNFLPPEILAIIFGGIAAMVFIGIVKSLAG